MSQSPTVRFIHTALRLSMAARGLHYGETTIPGGARVPQMAYLDGRRFYERHAGGRRGDPPTLAVFLHGLGSSVATWSTVLPRIARRVPLVAPDLPGFGRTPPPEGADFATFRDHVEAAHATLDALSPHAPVQLVGHSFGGWVAARVAADRPDRVHRLTLVNATGIAVPQVLDQRRLFTPNNRQELVDLWQRMWHRLPLSFRVFKRHYLAITRTPMVRGLLGAFAEDDLLDAATLARIRAPTLLVSGTADRLVEPVVLRAFEEGIRDTRTRTILACGHVPQRESRWTFLHLVLPWLEGREPPQLGPPAHAGPDGGAPPDPSTSRA